MYCFIEDVWMDGNLDYCMCDEIINLSMVRTIVKILIYLDFVIVGIKMRKRN